MIKHDQTTRQTDIQHYLSVNSQHFLFLKNNALFNKSLVILVKVVLQIATEILEFAQFSCRISLAPWKFNSLLLIVKKKNHQNNQMLARGKLAFVRS